jgi:hypothetical protein
MRRLLLPPGPLRRFRLPPGAARRERPEPGAKRRAWALVPFGAFGLLTYWLSAGRPLPDVRYWLEGPPRADRPAPEGSRPSAPRLEATPAIAAAQVADVDNEAAAAAPAPPAASPPPSKRPKRKPPLVLQRHRLRPVLGWEEPEGPTLGPVPRE